jgi:phosphoketolase
MASNLTAHQRMRLEATAARYRKLDAAFAGWAGGWSVIEHSAETQCRVHDLVGRLAREDAADARALYHLFRAADRVTTAAMWGVVHMTYARRVRLDGGPLAAEDFKPVPEGHTGGSLNMVPAYVGYLLANVLSATTRSWIMGQGHCVAAIEAVNVLIGNLSETQALQYAWTDTGLTKLVGDFYSYAIDAAGRPAAPIGSHVSVHTAGGISEGGYLGFAEIEYVHMPLKGERLVAFLSDGAFEEQRGSDWAPRWWRAEDSGLVSPVIILNGRRIEQRTDVSLEGGAWLRSHLIEGGFDPIDIDGRDPAAFAWAILEMEHRLSVSGEAAASGRTGYPVPLPYAIAHTIKGYGFPGAGTNRAHNLPLAGNPAQDSAARVEFNSGAARLWVEPQVLSESVAMFQKHESQGRPRERDHALVRRTVAAPTLPDPENLSGKLSPMEAIDRYFVRLIKANPHLRPRVGNPDELRSNHMEETLANLKHRVSRPEPGVAEAVDGAIVTVLNEEAVIGAALGNKGGINLAVSYEAFAVKMLGAIRQEVIFARHQSEAGRPPKWLSIPVIATSHCWENGKNEQSHQDPTFSEALLGEMSDAARVLFPVDANSAVAAVRSIYSTHGQIGCVVVPKRDVPSLFSPKQSAALLMEGALPVSGEHEAAAVQLVAVGAYQLDQCLRAASRLTERGLKCLVTCMIEPGRFRAPRDRLEGASTATDGQLVRLFPAGMLRVIVTHTRPEPLMGVLRRLETGGRLNSFLGYRNHGGTLDVNGMLFANATSWAHIVSEAGELAGASPSDLLSTDERQAISGLGNPAVLWEN